MRGFYPEGAEYSGHKSILFEPNCGSERYFAARFCVQAVEGFPLWQVTKK